MRDAEMLNDLVQINNDRIEGYNKAREQSKDEDLRSLFSEMADQSQRFVTELRQLVRSEGEEPSKGTTLKGKLYRAWMDVKATFTGKDRKSLLASCEFGEDAAQKAYRTALNDKDLAPDIQGVIRNQQADLKQSHDRIRNLRDAQP